MAVHTPEVIGPDHLTVLGLAAQIGAGACYALARSNKFWLLGAIVCLALNWLGDSLDGTLARVRQRLRPRYGFYVDHMVDSFGALALMGGLAFSGYMHPWIAVGLLIGFLMLSIQSYLAAHALGEFRLSFWKFGPTELRILLAVGKSRSALETNGASIRRRLSPLRRRRSYRFDWDGGDADFLHRAEYDAALSRRKDPVVTGSAAASLVRWLKFNLVGGVGVWCSSQHFL